VRKLERYRLEVAISAHVHDKRRKKQSGRPPALYNGPTPEMLAKCAAAHGVEQEPVLAGHDPCHRILSPMDAHKRRFDDDERGTAAALVRDLERAGSARVTAAYDGVPHAAYGPRAGGVPDVYREAHARIELFKRRIDRRFWGIALWLAGAAKHVADGQSMSVSDLGRQWTHYAGQDTSMAAGVALIKAALWRIEEEYRRERALTRDGETASELRNRLQIVQEHNNKPNKLP